MNKTTTKMTTEERLKFIEELPEWETHYPKHLEQFEGNTTLATECMTRYCEGKKCAEGLKSDELANLVYWASHNKFGSEERGK